MTGNLNNPPEELACCIERLSLESNSESTLSTYQSYIPFILGRASQLKSLCLKSVGSPRFFDAADGNYNLEKLKLHYKVPMDFKHLKFIYELKNLKLLKLLNVDSTVFDPKFYEELAPQ